MKRFISFILLVFAGMLSYAGNIDFDVFSSALPDTGRFVDSRDGNSYKTIKLGNQVWMAENLRYSKDIPLGTSKSNKPHVYNPNGSPQNVETYGLLYNWYAAEEACPNGWHLPTVSDWRALKSAISGDNAGSQLASKPELWNDGLLERSTSFGKSGFSVLPAGSFDGKSYGNFGSFAYFWTANEYEYYSGNAYFRYIYYNYGGVVSNYSSKSDGFSVRCVKD